MNAAGVLFALVAGTAAGVAVLALLAEHQLGGEVAAVSARLGFPPSKGGGGADAAIEFVDHLAPGTSDRLKTAVAVTAIGGVFAGVLVAGVIGEVLR